MWKTKTEAFRLRRNNKSYSEISRILDIPKGTLSGWFKNEAWSAEIRDRLGKTQSLAFPKKLKKIIAANKARWQANYRSYRSEAVRSFQSFKDNPLFLAGLMLYWGEGLKTGSSLVSLSNSDPQLIRLFYLFLMNAVGIEKSKIKIGLLLYPDLIDSVQKKFWSVSTGIPLSQFTKSTYIKGKHPRKRTSYGVCIIRFSNRELKEKILKWLELYQGHFSAQYTELV